MKLTPAQLSSLARDIAKKINQKRNEQIRSIKEGLKESVELTKGEEKAFRDLQNLVDGPLKPLGFIYNYDGLKKDLVNKKRSVIEKEKIQKAGLSQVETYSSEILDKLTIATIEAKDIDGLIAALAKDLGLNPKDLK